MSLRRAEPRDMAALAALERACFSLPRSEASLTDELKHSYKAFLVIEREGEIAAYGLFSCLFDQWEVERIGVSPRHRRLGLGKRLLDTVKEELAKAGGTLFLEVRDSNAPAIALYRSAGFAEYGRRARYYTDPIEDAVLMRLAVEKKSD